MNCIYSKKNVSCMINDDYMYIRSSLCILVSLYIARCIILNPSLSVLLMVSTSHAKQILVPIIFSASPTMAWLSLPSKYGNTHHNLYCLIVWGMVNRTSLSCCCLYSSLLHLNLFLIYCVTCHVMVDCTSHNIWRLNIYLCAE